jgi:hypothetical protein
MRNRVIEILWQQIGKQGKLSDESVKGLKHRMDDVEDSLGELDVALTDAMHYMDELKRFMIDIVEGGM